MIDVAFIILDENDVGVKEFGLFLERILIFLQLFVFLLKRIQLLGQRVLFLPGGLCVLLHLGELLRQRVVFLLQAFQLRFLSIQIILALRAFAFRLGEAALQRGYLLLCFASESASSVSSSSA